jgi:hypothetical protein
VADQGNEARLSPECDFVRAGGYQADGKARRVTFFTGTRRAMADATATMTAVDDNGEKVVAKIYQRGRASLLRGDGRDERAAARAYP